MCLPPFVAGDFGGLILVTLDFDFFSCLAIKVYFFSTFLLQELISGNVLLNLVIPHDTLFICWSRSFHSCSRFLHDGSRFVDIYYPVPRVAMHGDGVDTAILADDAGNTRWTRDMGFPNHRGLHSLWQGSELKFICLRQQTEGPGSADCYAQHCNSLHINGSFSRMRHNFLTVWRDDTPP